MTSRNDIIEGVREDDRRKRDDAKVDALQAQIDEMRRMTRELLSRQFRLEEQIKGSEASLAQYRVALDQHRHDVSQAAQARQLEDARVRQSVSELSARIDDSTRPIRTLQAHVAELIETVRRQREDSGHDTKQFDDLRAQIGHLAAHGERQITVAQGLRDSIEAVRVEVERQQRDLLRTDDGVRIVEQELRRRVAELMQQMENLAAHTEEELSVLGSLQAQIDELREAAKGIAPEFEVVHQDQQRLEADVARFNMQAVERDEITAERVEEIRQQFELQLRDGQEVADQRHERATQRVDQLEEVDRDLGYRIKMLEMQLEELHQIDRRMRREMWYLHEQRVRVQFEQAQQSLEAVIEARRDAERRLSDGAKPER